MASKTNTSTTVSPSYVDFEPYCEWKKEDDVETLIIRLPDFKRDQLRVQVNNQGTLKVSGERPMDNTHKSRFLKETKTPNGCDINQVRAKLTNGQLYVIMPKKVQPAPAPAPALVPTLAPAQQITESKLATKTEPEASSHNNEKEPEGSSSESQKTGAGDQMFGFRNSLAWFHDLMGKKVNVSLGIAAFAVVAIGAYAVYKCGSESSSSSSSSTKARIED